MSIDEVLENMETAEHLAFEHAAKLCREYRAENRSLRCMVHALATVLVILIGALIGVLMEVL